MEIEKITVTEYISYIKASENPLSADVVLVEGEEYLYVFDVGNKEQVAEYINSLPKKKRVILSHFHADHMGNIGRVIWDSVYFGAHTEKYFKHYIPDDAVQSKLPGFVTVSDSVKIQDGVSIEIHHIPNSHAKGSLILQVNEEYIFIGDSLYSKVEGNKYVYNAQLLKEEIELLKSLPGQKIFSSHEKRPIKSKAGVVRFLEQIYSKREKESPYIYIEN